MLAVFPALSVAVPLTAVTLYTWGTYLAMQIEVRYLRTLARYSRDGWPGIEDIATRVGILKGSLYYYIDSKESLLFKIFEDSHNEISTLTEAASSSDGRASRSRGT